MLAGKIAKVEFEELRAIESFVQKSVRLLCSGPLNFEVRVEIERFDVVCLEASEDDLIPRKARRSVIARVPFPFGRGRRGGRNQAII